jgi:hypothetical protein
MTGHLYTYVTHNERYFGSLLDSCRQLNIDPEVRGFGQRWEGYVKRHRDLLEFLETLDDSDIVINVDGFDTVVLCPMTIIMERFKAQKCDALFSMTADNGNMFQSYVQWKLGFYGEKANAGMFMGYAFKMKEVIRRILNDTEKYNDQIVVNKFIHKDPMIKIDTNREVFCNILNLGGTHVENGVFKYRNTQPCILSAPGCVDLRGLFKELAIAPTPFECNASQRIKEYYKYFMFEMLIAMLALAYLYTLRVNMKK